ncbi:MAG: alpha/beta fold hydrolase [Candidatus Eisenbacteria bacterium]|nr:alpha/beta fold hydrolase [Candidatus Eisenbacteria bacterium]
MFACLAAFLSLSTATAPVPESPQITSGDGRIVECSVFLPAGAGRVPCLVMAPGRGYHKDRPIFTDLAGQASAAGFAVFTFNWHYYSHGQEPSEDLGRELADLRAVVAHARSHPRVDGDRLVIGGKSMGSAIAADVFASDDSLAALILLTPVIPNEEAVAQNYPGLLTEKRPTLVVLGESDEGSCPLKVLYATLAQAVRPVPVVVVGGDHGLNIGSPEDPATVPNIAVANAAIVQWMRLWTAKR